MKGSKSILILLGFALPFVLIYRSFFLPGPLAWGDAPFFAPLNLKELFNPPFLWNFRNDNFGMPQYYILWLYLPTFLYGLLNHLLDVSNGFLIRLIFYFPATIFGIFGAWKFIGKFNENIYGKFFGSFLYGFNTYFLMLVDGGQVGVALAYGLFPLTVVTILNFLENFSVSNYLWALGTLFALFSADIRIALILVVFVGAVWVITGNGRIKLSLARFLLLTLSVAVLCSYWIIPTFSSGSINNLNIAGNLSGGNNFISLSNSLFLFQPHFPLNEFGKTSPTPFYFVFLLPLFFAGLIIKDKISSQRRTLKFLMLFLLLAFIAKGGSEPLGQFYSWLVSLPEGVAFRDSSKFYIPLILTGGLLFSFTVNSLGGFIKRRLFLIMALAGVYGYLLILIYPAILGNLSGVLGGENVARNNDYQKISQVIVGNPDFGRSLYLEEKPAEFFGNWGHPAISADNLYKERPFASMIVGKYDLFNYIYSPQFCQWLNLSGIKYVLLPQNERKKTTDPKDEESHQKLLETLSNTSCLSALNIGTSFPVYKTTGNMPLIFIQKKMVLVVGGEDIYNKLIQIPGFILGNQGFIFAEDGKIDLRKLSDLDPKSLVILFDKKGTPDLKLSYFSNLMVSPARAYFNQWKIYSSSDYLIWKYELLKQGIDTKEMDFGKGVALSTIPGEKMKFDLAASGQEDYFLAVRFSNALGSNIQIGVAGQEAEYTNLTPEQFKWQIIGPFKSEGKNVKVEITNKGKFSVVNTLVLIPVKDFQEADSWAKDLSSRYESIRIKDDKDWAQFAQLTKDNFSTVQYKQINPTQYWVSNLPDQPAWLVFTDHFDTGWNFVEDQNVVHIADYNGFNGFYLNGKSSKVTLYYMPQRRVKLAAEVSLSVAGLIGVVISLLLIRRRLKR